MEEKEKKSVAEQVEEMRIKARPDLVINRIPKKELAWFKEYAKEEFENDFGFAFKWLCQGYMPPENTELHEAIKAIGQRIETLENKVGAIAHQEESEEKEIRTGDGSFIRRKRK